MRLILFTTALAVFVLAGCTTQPSGVTSFSARQVSPAPGSVLDLSTGATITITGPLTVEEGVYYTMVYVRDDGTVFLPGEWGPSSGSSSWSDYRFSQDAAWRGHVTEELFARFCSRGTVTEASFVTSTTSILTHSAINSPQHTSNIFENFNWNIVRNRVDIPLNYTCR